MIEGEVKVGQKIIRGPNFFYRPGLILLLTIWLVFLFGIVNQANAQTQGRYKTLHRADREKLSLMIRKDTSITVERYDSSIDVLFIQINTALDVGPNVTTWPWLIAAIDNGMIEKEMRRNPSRLVGAVFTLKKNLYLLSDEEMTKRKIKQAEKKARAN